MEFHYCLVAVRGTPLTTFPNPRKGEVIELSSKRGKGCVIKVPGQDFRLDLGPVVNNNPSQHCLTILLAWRGINRFER